MTVTLTHVVFKVSGEPSELAAFDARLKVLFAEYGIGNEVEEQHTPAALHYDLKVAGGIPFPPFALASADFPELVIAAEWIDLASGVRGAATITSGALTGQNVENVAAAGAGFRVAIRVDANGYLALGMAVVHTGPDECRGYVLTGDEDALFRIVRDSASGEVDLAATEGAAEWSRAWRVPSHGQTEYRAIEPAQPIADADFHELETIAQNFVAQWVWFGNGPREEIIVEAERYARLGYIVSDANLRSAALHRIKADSTNDGGGTNYSTLDAEIAWIEDVIARCWPRHESPRGSAGAPPAS
jgi:hypothetical protein